MTHTEVREKFLKFFESRGHKIAPSSSLIPNDASVLFTTAGMQQMKPYYLGEKSPWGDKVVSVQKCLRTNDIEEVGDDTHLTFFEMLGNFAFNNAVSKKEAISWAHEFITTELGLKIDYVTIFGGDDITPKDEESEKIWRDIAPGLGIKEEGRADVFWGPTGDEGPCGPTTEIYINGVEIWNIVFNEYYKDKSGNYTKLENFGIDTGMGLERLLVQVQGVKNVYETDLFFGEKTKEERIVTDHVKAAMFLVSDGVVPNAKGQGSTLRRLIRRAVTFSESPLLDIIEKIKNVYKGVYEFANEKEIAKEESAFDIETLRKTIRERIIRLAIVPGNISSEQKELELDKNKIVPARVIFDLYQSNGSPLELISEICEKEGITFDKDAVNVMIKEHQDKSRSASAGMFKGGLANHEEKTIKLHTAHHLLLAALQKILGPNVKQRGSNINEERLRIDFAFDRKLTDDEKKEIENIVNEAITKDYKVIKREMSREEAERIGAEMEFGAKYSDTVTVYFIEDQNGNAISKEFCGGPHVTHTGDLGHFKIQKEEASSAGVRRIKAILE